jgi:histone deacetylase 11
MIHFNFPIRRTSAVGLVFVILVPLNAGCMSNDMKRVGTPREGQAINQRVCIVYSNQYQIRFGGIERLHPFDIRKYERIYTQLVTDGLISPADVFVPTEISREDLQRVHTKVYLDERLKTARLLAHYLEIGFLAIVLPSVTDAAILKPFRHATGGTILAADLALKHGIAINIGGGYHHAEPDRGGGFCVYADMPIAVRKLQSEGRIRRALMIDVDVHQGNGTAVCLADDPDVFTFDMFEEHIYPQPKGKNDLDVPLASGLEDDEYLDILSVHLPAIFDKAKPDILFLQAGVDSLAGDPLANMRLSIDGIVKRDAMIFDQAVRRGVPIVMTLGGGYSPDAWRAQYESIANLLRTHGGATTTRPTDTHKEKSKSIRTKR